MAGISQAHLIWILYGSIYATNCTHKISFDKCITLSIEHLLLTIVWQITMFKKNWFNAFHSISKRAEDWYSKFKESTDIIRNIQYDSMTWEKEKYSKDKIFQIFVTDHVKLVWISISSDPIIIISALHLLSSIYIRMLGLHIIIF